MTESEESFNMTTSKDMHSYTALQIRLETNQLLENVELFLRGAKIVIEQEEDGTLKQRRVNIGTSKANDEGIQAILNYVQQIVNPQVVQGNFPCDRHGHSDMYESYIQECQVNMATFLMENLYNWEILESDYNVIIDGIMMLVQPYMSRLIGNEERKSYIDTIQHKESTHVQEGKKGLKLFGG